MAYEKRLKAVPAQLFTADGTAAGKVLVADTSLFKVKQEVYVSANTLPNLELEVKQIDDATTMYVGPRRGNISTRENIAAYTVALGATIAANEQKRPSVPAEEINRAVYEEEPTVALRTTLVDGQGDKYTSTNPLPVQLTDGNINIDTLNAEIQVQLDHEDKPGKTHDSVRVGDGNNELGVNNDGSINVNIVQSPSISLEGLTFHHNEISSVASGVETTLFSMVVVPVNFRVTKIQVSGDNVAHFRVKVDGQTVANKRTYFTEYNQEFSFESFQNGLKLLQGQQLTVTVIHNRPNLGSFEATVMGT